MFIYIYVCICMYTYVCIYIRIYMYMWICIYVITYVHSAKRFWSACFGLAATQYTLTGAILLLLDVGTLNCWVSPLARFAPP